MPKTTRPGWRKVESQHGTVTGYKQHMTAGEPACEPCEQANRADTREYNRRTGYALARGRAYLLLAREHDREYRELFATELTQIRRDHPELTKRTSRDRARNRASIALAETYPERFGALLAEQRAKVKASPGAGPLDVTARDHSSAASR